MRLYFLDQDGDCHWYIVDADRRADWNKWRDLDSDDPAGWECPPYARPLDGSPSGVEFPALETDSIPKPAAKKAKQ